MGTTGHDGSWTDGNGVTYREPTDKELAPGHAVRKLIEETLEEWAPNHVSDTGRVTSYDDWVERADGIPFPGEFARRTNQRIDLGGSTAAGSTYAKVKAIARSVAKDLR